MKIRRKKASAAKKLLTVLVSCLAVVFLVLLAGTIYVESLLGRMYQHSSQQETLSAEQIQQFFDSEEVSMDPTAEMVDSDDVDWGDVDKIATEKHIINILLIGQDRREYEVRSRSDVMILVTVNTKTNAVVMTSFLRDIYVKIPGYVSNRINVPYFLGGAELLFDTIELNFGIRPDKYVEVDFSGFKDIVDLMGGVDMELTQQEAYHLNSNPGMYGFKEEIWNLKEGVNHLTGSQALSYSRIRMIDPTGDFARTERQRKMISALIEKAASLDLLQINSLLLEMTDMITTDMSPSEILSYARLLYPVLKDMGEVKSQRIPMDGTYYLGNVEGIGSVIIPDFSANSEMIAGFQK